ncbi:MAG: glycoside hydrolase family 31 protein [Prevotellaceae bacterium]|nr:glycoside hydrolase family 31 protein [Prevotellaceae bacterium]
MKKACLSILWSLLCLPLFPQTITRTAAGLKADVPGCRLRCEVTFYSPNIVRVVKYPYPVEEMPAKQSLSVVMQPGQPRIDCLVDGAGATLKSDALTVTLDKATGALTFRDRQGNRLLQETRANFEMRTEGLDQGAYRVAQSFHLDDDEAVYGLGQSQNGLMIQRGYSKELFQDNQEDVVPLLHSIKGYGIFWDNYSTTTYTDTDEETTFDSEVGDCVDYYFLYGGNADGVVSAMRALTGDVPMLPLWAYGYFQSKERYQSQDELVGVVENYRKLGIPLDGIIQDWQYWGNNYLWNAMEFLASGYPDPQKMMNDIHALHAHCVISVWASFGPMTKPYRELSRKGMLMDFTTWPPSGLDSWPPKMDYPSGVKVYDVYNPEARDIYWKYMQQGLFAYGMDGWWLDSTEPDMEFTPQLLENKTYLGSYRKLRNAFPLMTVGGVYDHQRAVSNDKRVFILTRSAFAGQQRYGADTWTGDVTSTWDVLRKQIPAGLNFSLTGIPHWNTDIGGFFAGAYNTPWNGLAGSASPLYQELYVRWLQFGAFTPMMRSHGTDMPREIYRFGSEGEPVYDAIARAIRLRYALLPYIYSTAWQVTHARSTFMRALMMDFPADHAVWNISDEYLFGPSILAAPVVKAQYTTEELPEALQAQPAADMQVDFTATKETTLYLPQGTTWYDFWTGDELEGGQQVRRATTLDMIPLFLKAGSILPIGPDVQYATEQPWDNLELRVYPGADGTFTLYEDEGDNYNYEQGAYTEIPMTWNDRRRTLTIGARKGSYDGMPVNRTFTVKLPDGTVREIAYSGKAVSVKL